MSNTTRRLALVAATVVAIAGLAACKSADAAEASKTVPSVAEAPAAPTTEVAPTTAAVPTTEAPATTAAPTTTAAPATTVPAPVPVPPVPAPAPPTTVAATMVTRVVDGDTVEVSTGAKIRLIGIDTPEVGQCGYAPAAQRLQALVAGKGVTLTPGARDDVDKYGRLLRYLDVAGTDAGYTLVQEGLAIARYDSRDGYGRHARQDLYVAADSVSASVCAAARCARGPGRSGRARRGRHRSGLRHLQGGQGQRLRALLPGHRSGVQLVPRRRQRRHRLRVAGRRP